MARRKFRISMVLLSPSKPKEAASSKATVGSAYGMAPAYPKTESEADRDATARYHAMNNLYFLNTAIHGEYPKAFVGATPYEGHGIQSW
jgi:beta-glucosidase